MTMDVRMPVVTAVERRCEQMRRARIRIAVLDMANFVWILAVQAAQCEAGESRGHARIERGRCRRLTRGVRAKGEESERGSDHHSTLQIEIHHASPTMKIPTRRRLSKDSGESHVTLRVQP